MNSDNDNSLELLERKATLRILTHLLIEDLCITDFIHGKKFNKLASQNALSKSLKNLRELQLIEEYVIHVGITKVTQINYTLTEKGKAVAQLVLKIQERLEAE